MSDRRPPPRRLAADARTDRRRGALLVGAAAWILGGCAGGRDAIDERSVLGERTDTLEASLRALGDSGARGTVRFAQAADGLTLSVYFYNVPAGRYRVAVHANGICSSPNGFSAGAPWVPPGASQPIVIEFAVDEGAAATLSQRVAGLALTGPLGVSGRSAVIHGGRTGTLEAVPDLPNNRVACGVFGPVLRYF